VAELSAERSPPQEAQDDRRSPSCCARDRQAFCCEPDAKADCCGGDASATCGCSDGTPEGRQRYLS
jgi:hypothetical protein